MDKKLQEKLMDNNIFFVHTRTDDQEINESVVRLMAIAADDPKAEIQFFITGGLDFGYAMPLYDAIRAIPNPVFGIGMGQISDFSVLLLCACSSRAVLKHASLLVTEPYGVLDAGSNQQTEVYIATKEAEAEMEVYTSLLAKHSGHSLEEIRAVVLDEKRFTAEEAKEFGLIDEIIL